MGVGVLGGKTCESQAPNFSFAFAKGKRGDAGVGWEDWEVPRSSSPLTPPSVRESSEVWKKCVPAVPAPRPRKVLASDLSLAPTFTLVGWRGYRFSGLPSPLGGKIPQLLALLLLGSMAPVSRLRCRLPGPAGPY